jgi:hypothetical protein
VAWKSVRSDGSSRMSLRGHRPTILRIVGGRGIGVLRGLGLLGRITIELTSWGTILAPLPAKLALRWEETSSNSYAAFQRSTIDIVPRQLANSHGSVFMAVHLNERKASIRLESSFDNIAKVLEQRNKVILSRVGREITDVYGGLPLGRLGNDHIVTLNTMSRKVVVTVRRGRRHSHRGHGCLLRHGRLALLIGPIATDSARSQPFTVHGAQSLLCIRTFAKRNETVATRATSFHIPHNTGFRNRSERGEGLGENFVVDFVAKVPNEYMEMIASVFFV